MAWDDGSDSVLGPVAEGDPLAQLGLVDPKTGLANAAPDWKPPEDYAERFKPFSQAGAPVAGGDDDDGDDDDSEPAQQDPAQPQAQVQAKPDWDSDDNPYKKQVRELSSKLGPTDPAQQAPAQFNARVQQLQNERATALQLLTTTPQAEFGNQPMPRQVAELMVNALYTAAVSQAQLEHDRAVLMPTAKTAVANRIAEEYSVGGVKIDPKDLLGYDSVDAMKARAETMRDMGRDKSFRQRRSGGSDRVESASGGGGATTKEAIESLSPFHKIALGLRRGD